MGGIKALIIAGVVVMAALAPALAADLPPAPPLEEPLRGAIDEESGFYLRGDVGVGINQASRLNSTFGTGQTLADLGAWDGPVNVGDSTLAGIGAGYKFNEWFRADVTGEYRSSASYNSKAFYQYTGGGSNCPVGGPTNCGDNYNASLRSGLFLANGYLDMGTWIGVAPYIGGGLGVVTYGVSGLTDISMSQPNGYGLAPNNNSANFAWALTAGAAFRVTPNLMLDLSYRYVNLGSFNTAAIACNGGASTGCAYESQHFNMASNDIRLGLRWLLIPAVAPEPVLRTRY
ncbi:outer membrane protein [Rhodoblastus sp.]|uniref:outer membrane protein n=1 Tax=Rhodoblastus sp. TaxID=1962975 RepID=UPI003F9B593B